MALKIPAWVNAYNGIPFLERGRDRAGCDCWGLFRLIHAERYQIDLPDFTGYAGTSSKADGQDIARLINGWIDQGDWLPVDWRIPGAGPGANGVRWPSLREGDGVLLRVDNQPWHIGIMVTPRIMLHTLHNEESHPEELDSQRWVYRILDIRRHRQHAHSTT